MPVTIRRNDKDLERLRATRESTQYFQDHLDEIREIGAPYVVLHRDELVADGETAEEAWEQARAQDAPLDQCILIWVPEEGESYFF